MKIQEKYQFPFAVLIGLVIALIIAILLPFIYYTPPEPPTIYEIAQKHDNCEVRDGTVVFQNTQVMCKTRTAKYGNYVMYQLPEGK